jgi:hypothetical protein
LQEINPNFADELAVLLGGFGFRDVDVVRDMSGKARILTCKKEN